MAFFLGTEFLVFEIFFPFVTLYSEKKLKFSFYHTSKYLTLVSFAMFQSPVPSIGTEEGVWVTPALFRNKRFVLNEMFQQNASKFAIFYV